MLLVPTLSHTSQFLGSKTAPKVANPLKIASLPKVCQIVKVRDEGGQKVAKNLIKMVGACGFEPQTPTVSR